MSGSIHKVPDMTLTRPGEPRSPGGSNGGGPARTPGGGAEGNARLTASTAVVLLVLLAAEGFTILQIRPLLSPHIFIGMVLVPPVLVKIGSTMYRFVRYYRHDPDYRRKGPPPVLLRLLGPLVVLTTVVVLASGVALVLTGPAWRQKLLLLHKASFILWFGAMTVHVVGHLLDTARLAPGDWVRRTRRDVAGASARQWTIVASIVVGVLLGLLLVGRAGPWLASGPQRRASAHHGLVPVAPVRTSGPTTTAPATTTTSVPPPPTAVPLASPSPPRSPTRRSAPTTPTTTKPAATSPSPTKTRTRHHGGTKAKQSPRG
jgi:hypothetical protein